MPTSHHNQLNEIVELLMLSKPQSLLDVGVGFGKYGFLAREYLELWDSRKKYRDWTRVIDGIEAFKDYKTPLYDFVYNRVYFGNALEILPSLKKRYDLILLIDVLEHFSYGEGLRILKECKKRGRNLIVSTPKNVKFQKDAFDNPYETHKFQWGKKHFSMFEQRFFVPNKNSLICFMGEDADMVKRKWTESRISSLFYPYSNYMYRKALKERVKERLPILKYPYKVVAVVTRKLFGGRL